MTITTQLRRDFKTRDFHRNTGSCMYENRNKMKLTTDRNKYTPHTFRC